MQWKGGVQNDIDSKPLKPRIDAAASRIPCKDTLTTLSSHLTLTKRIRTMEIQVTEACCNTPPTKAAWVKKGAFKALSKHVAGVERTTYRVGPVDSDKGVVALIDIHGFHPTTVQFLDVSYHLSTKRP